MFRFYFTAKTFLQDNQKILTMPDRCDGLQFIRKLLLLN